MCKNILADITAKHAEPPGKFHKDDKIQQNNVKTPQ